MERFYRLAVKCGKVKTPAETTRGKVMQIREWHAAVPQDQLLKAIQDLEVIYVPAAVAPGPGLLFPIRDVSREIRRAHIRVNDEAVYGVRYISAVDRSRFIGPPWLGTDDWTIAAMVHYGFVLVVEGPLDLLAIRTMCPGLPSLCSLTKKLGKHHWAYLKMLGITKVYVMFDNETKGIIATEAAEEAHPDFEIVAVRCPAKDPAECLKTPVKLRALQKCLSALIPTPPVILEEDD